MTAIRVMGTYTKWETRSWIDVYMFDRLEGNKCLYDSRLKLLLLAYYNTGLHLF